MREPQSWGALLLRRKREREAALAPPGAPIALALDAANLMPAAIASSGRTHWPAGLSESFRPVATRLASKFIEPGEQILGAAEAHDAVTGTPVGIVVFTRGLAVKVNRREFRLDTQAKFSTHGYDPHPTASLWIDDLVLMLAPDQDDAALFDALNLQGDMRARPAPKAKKRPASKRSTPGARVIRTPRDAELAAADWMAYFGYTNVVATPVGADGGIDVTSDQAVAQVKAEIVPNGRPTMQQHHGAATAHRKTGVFFSLAGYTSHARAYADENGIVLFSFNLQGEVEPVNPPARALMQRP